MEVMANELVTSSFLQAGCHCCRPTSSVGALLRTRLIWNNFWKCWPVEERSDGGSG